LDGCLSLCFSGDEVVEVGESVLVFTREANARKEVDSGHSTKAKKAVGDRGRHVTVGEKLEEALWILCQLESFGLNKSTIWAHWRANECASVGFDAEVVGGGEVKGGSVERKVMKVDEKTFVGLETETDGWEVGEVRVESEG
jgi:hypothetical protein